VQVPQQLPEGIKRNKDTDSKLQPSDPGDRLDGLNGPFYPHQSENTRESYEAATQKEQGQSPAIQYASDSFHSIIRI
jgi:hypothetical protein